MYKKEMLPVNLQLFADDPSPEPNNDPNPADPPKSDKKSEEPNDAGTKPEEYTVEGLLAQLTQAKADQARMKTEYDKLCTSEGNLRKQLRAKQTAEEQAAEAEAEAKRQQEEHTKAVERELATMKAANRYLELGFSKEEADKIAADEVSGDMDAWKAGVDNFLANQRKNAYAQARADLMKEMPIPQSGNDATVDYSQKFNEAMENGDKQSAILALLDQSKANGAQV